jgi:diguanylate cyclase (GGDEF) domain
MFTSKRTSKGNHYAEAVIVDNAFHRRLDGVRNDKTVQNHPDIETMLREHQQQLQHLQRTLQQMPVISVNTQTEDAETTAERDAALPALYSFRYCMEQLQREVRRADKFRRPLSVLMVSFPELSLVQRSYGELAQDRAVRFISTSLAQYVDGYIDFIGRYGTDKFILILPETQSSNANMLAEQIRVFFMGSNIDYHQYSFNLKATIGIAGFPTHGGDWKELIAKADLAADMITSNGGNAVGFSP